METDTRVYIDTYRYTYTERERERDREKGRKKEKKRERERPKRFVRKILDKSAAAKYSNWMKLDKNES